MLNNWDIKSVATPDVTVKTKSCTGVIRVIVTILLFGNFRRRLTITFIICDSLMFKNRKYRRRYHHRCLWTGGQSETISYWTALNISEIKVMIIKTTATCLLTTSSVATGPEAINNFVHLLLNFETNCHKFKYFYFLYNYLFVKSTALLLWNWIDVWRLSTCRFNKSRSGYFTNMVQKNSMSKARPMTITSIRLW